MNDEMRGAYVETSGGEGLIALHPDLVLRAAEVDVTRPEDALRFINAYGPMGVDPTVALDRGHPTTRSDIWRRREAFYGLAVFPSAEQDRLAAERARLQADPPASHPDARNGYEGVEAFASGVATLARVVSAWLWLSQSGSEPPDDPGEDAEVLAVVLDDALSVFAPRVHWQPDGEASPEAAPYVPLFCALALQLAHLVVEGERLRPCLACGKLLHVAQRDPTTARFLRSDVKYCNDRCRNRFHSIKRGEKRRQERIRRSERKNA